MKLKNKKKIILILFIIIILILLSIIIYYKGKTNVNGNIDLSENFVKNKIYDGLDITEIKAEHKNGYNELRFNLENNTEEDYLKNSIENDKSKSEGEKNVTLTYIIFYDKNKKEIGRDKILIPNIKKGELNVEVIKIDRRLLKADNFKLSDY